MQFPYQYPFQVDCHASMLDLLSVLLLSCVVLFAGWFIHEDLYTYIYVFMYFLCMPMKYVYLFFAYRTYVFSNFHMVCQYI